MLKRTIVLLKPKALQMEKLCFWNPFKSFEIPKVRFGAVPPPGRGDREEAFAIADKVGS